MQSQLKTIFLLLSFLLTSSSLIFATSITSDSTGFDGDHFSLEGALDLFQSAKSLEDFETALNSEKNYVNNLDLNQDGDIDYIRVVDHQDGDVHAIVLQVPIDEKESQDVAVIEIEKTGNEEAMLQIIGDEDVFGESKIVEPYEVEAKSIGKGPNADLHMTRVIINVWGWPTVRVIYGPRYRPYVSPWGWRTYPRFWRPWRPLTWRVYRTHRVVRPGFRVVSTHRVVRAHRVYTPRRTSCKVVRTRTTVVKNRNGKVVGAKTTRTKTVRGKNGKVKSRTSTTKAAKRNKNGTVTGKKKTTKVKKSKGKTKAGKRTTKTTRKRKN